MCIRDRRTGVALAAGLLFLFVTEILLLFLAGNSLYKEEQGKLGALVPVSYTHLDVYKRQILVGKLLVSAIFLALLISISNIIAPATDVYKRQVSGCGYTAQAL